VSANRQRSPGDQGASRQADRRHMHKILIAGAAALLGFWVIVPTASSSSGNVTTNVNGPESVPSAAVARLRVDASSGSDDGGAVHEHPSRAGENTSSVSMRPTVVVQGASDERQALVDDALARFADAGLRLPDLGVVFADDPSKCGGHDGLFLSQHDPWQVLVCSDLEFVVTHEFAHAWEAANLDDDDRANYVERRGLTTWDSPDAPWGERGVEDLAFMMQQNLMAGHVDAASDRWIERTDAYAWATGTVSPVLDVTRNSSTQKL